MKTLMTAAFVTLLFVGSSADARMMVGREAVQNFYYYFGAPCKVSMCDECGNASSGDVVSGVFNGMGNMVSGAGSMFN